MTKMGVNIPWKLLQEIVPPSRAECLTGKGSVCLQAVNGSEVATYGIFSLTFNIGLRRSSSWVFVIADISQPILGADFLYNFAPGGYATQ